MEYFSVKIQKCFLIPKSDAKSAKTNNQKKNKTTKINQKHVQKALIEKSKKIGSDIEYPFSGGEW